jgi:hypothetical protein
MVAFSEILPLFGVDAAKGFMMVPVGGFNLIYHFLGKSTSFSNTGHLSIRDVTDDIRKAPDVWKISKNPKQPLFVDKDDNDQPPETGPGRMLVDGWPLG